jgi:2-keto-3-deoxy-6-phosphogluconate aldolase
LPTGGVTLETMAEYLAAGASALGVGAALADVGSWSVKAPTA